VVLSKDPLTVAAYQPQLEFVQGAEPHRVHWTEAHHDRVFDVGEVHEQGAAVFDFSTPQGMRYRLLPMTLELYDKHVKNRTMGAPRFGSVSELLEVMRREW
jgi:hypothetical protein